jgi:hypothetical protein
MVPELDAWVGMFNLIRTEFYQALVPSILKKGKATDTDLSVFALMQSEMNETTREQIKKR